MYSSFVLLSLLPFVAYSFAADVTSVDKYTVLGDNLTLTCPGFSHNTHSMNWHHYEGDVWKGLIVTYTINKPDVYHKYGQWHYLTTINDAKDGLTSITINVKQFMNNTSIECYRDGSYLEGIYNIFVYDSEDLFPVGWNVSSPKPTTTAVTQVPTQRRTTGSSTVKHVTTTSRVSIIPTNTTLPPRNRTTSATDTTAVSGNTPTGSATTSNILLDGMAGGVLARSKESGGGGNIQEELTIGLTVFGIIAIIVIILLVAILRHKKRQEQIRVSLSKSNGDFFVSFESPIYNMMHTDDMETPYDVAKCVDDGVTMTTKTDDAYTYENSDDVKKMWTTLPDIVYDQPKP